MPSGCFLCGLTKAKHDTISLVRLPKEERKRKLWLSGLNLTEGDMTDLKDPRICTRHFRDGNTRTIPSVSIGKYFGSPIKSSSERARRAAQRHRSPLAVINGPESSADSSTPKGNDSCNLVEWPLLCAQEGTVLDPHCDDYVVEEVVVRVVQPAEPTASSSTTSAALPSLSTSVHHPTTSIAPANMSSDTGDLLKMVWQLKKKNAELQAQLDQASSLSMSCYTTTSFRLDAIMEDDKLVRFYTGFASYDVFLAFFRFLGPAVDCLHYWGDSSQQKRLCSHKLDPLNQLFLTLIKLRLNLQVTDLAFRFGLSDTTVSKYLTTWISFLYHQLSEIDWFPSVEQVSGTLPTAFKDKYPTTYIIIDATEIFIETPSDLFLQSSTWSNYKQHNTGKFLVGCTPNGAIIFVSDVYAGSISDPELTRECGLLQKLEDKRGVSIMADRGFTITEDLQPLGIELNIPPFLDGRAQLPPGEVQKGRSFASVHIHVERAIGRIKHFSILKDVYPVTMMQLLNQVVHVCAYLCNFPTVLVPMPTNTDVDMYFNACSDDSDSSES